MNVELELLHVSTCAQITLEAMNVVVELVIIWKMMAIVAQVLQHAHNKTSQLQPFLNLDVDECLMEAPEDLAHNCHSNANCINTDGSFMCLCSNGYSGDGRNCTSKFPWTPDVIHEFILSSLV